LAQQLSNRQLRQVNVILEAPFLRGDQLPRSDCGTPAFSIVTAPGKLPVMPAQSLKAPGKSDLPARSS
jgi:hypothetical protein